MRATKRLGIAIVLALLLGSCWGGDDDDSAPDRDPAPARDTGAFGIRLSAGTAPEAPAEVEVVAGDPLDDDAIAGILERLPDFEGEDGDRVPFNRPPEPLPRPRVGRTIDTPFGGDGDGGPPPPVDDGPLEVLRSQPDGEVDVAPFISVTFDQPMVPIGTLEQLDQADVPVRVTPELDGRWRWLGTRTLRFDPATDSGDSPVDRLPAATEYRVEVPAGTESANGNVLAEAHTFSFATPAPVVRQVVPGGDVVDVQPAFVAVFDQIVDGEAVLDHLTLRADGSERGVRLASADEIDGDDDARAAVDAATPGRWVAFTPDDPLPGDVAVEIEFEAGTPSAEGPRTKPEAQTHETRTRAPLTVTKTRCGVTCRAGDSFTIEFNNPLDPASFSLGDLAIEPAIAASIGTFANTISIQAETVANTTYEVTIPSELGDTFGQTLGEDETFSFDVGAARPRLTPIDSELTTVDPYARRPAMTVTSSGHEQLRVTLYDVGVGDFADYLRHSRDHEREHPLDGLPQWPRISSEVIDVPGGGDTSTETTIDLSAAIPPVDGDGTPTGHVVVTVETTETYARDTEEYYENLPTVTWAQATSIGIDAVGDADSLVAWTSSLRDGTPLDGVDVRLENGDSGTTGLDGLATVGLTGPSDFLVATAGDDSAILEPQENGRWAPRAVGDEARWYVIDDRQLYRPGETVNVKGWVRRLALSGDASIAPIGDGTSVRYVVHDGFGNEVAADTAELTSTGGFDFSVDLPAGVALGQAWVQLDVEGADAIGGTEHQHQFQIEEFRRPEFEVVTEAVSPEPHVLTRALTLSAVGRYFAGGVLPDAPVTWQVAHEPTVYSPPNRSRYRFGVERPIYLDYAGHLGGDFSTEADFRGGHGHGDPCCPPFENPDLEQNTYRSRTDATGTDLLRLDFEGDTPDEPITVSANASVEDVNRQSYGSTLDLLVHPASLYVGLRSARTFVRQGEPLEIEAIVTDIDGEAVTGRSFTVTAARVTEEFVDGEWTEVDVDEQECATESADPDEGDPTTCSFETSVGGRYRITAIVTDDDGGRNRTEITRWVSGAQAIPSRAVEEETALVIPADEEYAPGDTAELLVVSPFSPATGMLTVVRNGIAETRTIELDDGSAVVQLPITDALVPGVDVRVEVAGAAERVRDDGSTDDDLPPRPAYATGGVTLPVRPTTKTLDVTATPADELIEPGESTSVEVAVAGPDGAPVAGAEVAVVVVDEAVLSLVGYELPDPLDAFYGPLFPHVRSDRSRRTLRLQDPEQLTAGPAAPQTTVALSEESLQSDDGARSVAGGAGGADGDAAFRNTAGSLTEPIDVRTDFDALAVFEPAVPTGADGTATVDVTVPDNLTRYRVMAVAADAGDRFGSGESTITARLPLQVRPSAPRFVNFGDRFELPVVVQNQGEEDLSVAVVVETANLTVDGAPGTAVDVAAGERVEVRFPIEVEDAGTARFRVTAVSGDLADSASGSLPAYTPVTTEAFATYGVIDDGAILQPLLAPEGVVPQFGGLDFDTSSTAVQALTDAVVYLSEYEHGSADAYATRITALVALRDVFAAFDTATAPEPSELDATIRSDIESLIALQGDDGGFGTWKRGLPSQPFLSVQAAHALVVAEAAGYPVGGDAKARALEYARTIEDRFPADWDEASRTAASAYALHVRDLAGDRDPGKAEDLFRSHDDMALDALAWIWPVVDAADVDGAIADTFEDRVAETPSAATFTSAYDESSAALVLSSDRRTDGIVLDALIRRRPDSDLIPKVVTGLIGNQVKGRWNNIQENGFILLAMQRYFSTFEDVDPAFVARAWLGDTYAAEHAHQGRSIDTTHTLVPMSDLLELSGADGDEPGDLVVAKEGPGRLYYRLGLRYAPDDLRQDARDEGFVVERRYEAVDDPDDVRRDGDGTWRIRPGATVRVRLSMVADSARTNMALVDSLPAGLEAVNPALAASPRTTPEELDEGGDAAVGRSIFRLTWFDHQEFRDDRASAYGAWLPAGTYDYTYVARATTPGTFVAPPTKAEEIYAPEVFGRSASDTVVIGD